MAVASSGVIVQQFGSNGIEMPVDADDDSCKPLSNRIVLFSGSSDSLYRPNFASAS
jgi:hypothetical protein